MSARRRVLGRALAHHLSPSHHPQALAHHFCPSHHPQALALAEGLHLYPLAQGQAHPRAYRPLSPSSMYRPHL